MKYTIMKINNIIQFSLACIDKKTPLRLWPKAWKHVKACHERDIHNMLTEMTMDGKIIRRIGSDGEPIYYPNKEDLK